MTTESYFVNSFDLIRLAEGEPATWTEGTEVFFEIITNIDNLAPRLVSYGLIAVGFDDVSQPRDFPFLLLRSQTIWDGGCWGRVSIPRDALGYPILAFQPNSNASGQTWTLTIDRVVV